MKTLKIGMILVVMACALGLASCATTSHPTTNPSLAVAPLAPDAVVTWADDAWAAFQAEVPKAVQKIAKKQIEKEARERGIALIGMALYDEIKKEQGH
jgi:hypothetical protein